MTSAVDENGKYVLKNHVLVRFRFSGITDLSLDGFNAQNVLQEICIEHQADSDGNFAAFEIIFEDIYGMHATFKCESVSIESVDSYDP
ncbi:MAG: Imm50 family immunity protein [Pyrinomonadaceae bacterium]